MPWLGKISPVMSAEKKQHKIPAFTTWGTQKGWRNVLRRLPFFEQILLVLSTFILYLKLNAIKNEITSNPFENLDVAKRLYWELLLAKKYSHKILHSRINKLKKRLLANSYFGIMKFPTKEVEPTSSTSQLLTVMKQSMTPQKQLDDSPAMMHWRYSQAEATTTSYIPSPTRPCEVFLHASCQQLLEILMANNIAHHRSEVILHQNAFGEEIDNRLVCCISLELTAEIEIDQSIPKSSFWKQQPLTLSSHLLHDLNTNTLIERIGGIFFQEKLHYHEFKELLTQSKNTTLINLIDALERNQQIFINGPNAAPAA